MHVHVGVLELMTTAAAVIIVLFALRQIAARYADSPWGKGLAAIVA